jgi:hypothetical protein
LEVETKEALDSSDWLNISAESVLEFLDMECLNINEAVLVWALIRWGKFQLKQQNGGGENLRSKILPGLRKIRFNSLTQHEVAQLCSKELGEVLTGDEKSSIFMSIITENWEKMPTDVVSPSKLTPRHAPYTFISLPYQEDPLERGSGNARQTAIRFHINKSATVIGVKLNTNAFGHDSLSSITLGTILNDIWTVIGIGDPKATSLHRGEKFYRINSIKSLVGFKECYLMFKFAEPICDSDGMLKIYTLSKDKHQSNSGDLALTIMDSKLSSFAHVLGIVFDNVSSS